MMCQFMSQKTVSLTFFTDGTFFNQNSVCIYIMDYVSNSHAVIKNYVSPISKVFFLKHVSL